MIRRIKEFVNLKQNLARSLEIVLLPVIFIVLTCLCFCGRNEINPKKARVVFGKAGIMNNVYWCRSLRAAGHWAELFSEDFPSVINKRLDYGRLLEEEFHWCPRHFKFYLAFLDSVFKYDIFVMAFDGYFLSRTLLKDFEAYFLRLARKKTIVIPYGSDAYIYRYVESAELQHALMMSLNQESRRQRKILKQVDYWVERADVVIPGMMGIDGIGRWDVLAPSSLVVDVDDWKVSQSDNGFDGLDGEVRITHSPNFRGFKGTEFLLSAIDSLRREGLRVKINLLEGIPNDEVRQVLQFDTDILVEQLIFTGHGLNGVEGMASGLPVVSNLEDARYTKVFKRWSYLDECPIVSSDPEKIADTLRELITQPEIRKSLGKLSRGYAEKYHSYKAGQFLFESVLEYLVGERESLIDLYHPLKDTK